MTTAHIGPSEGLMESVRAMAKTKAHTGFVAYSEDLAAFDDNSTIGTTNWPPFPTSRIRLIDLWWKGSLRCSIGGLRREETLFYLRTASVSYQEGSVESPRLLSRSIGILTNGVETLRLSVCESTGWIGS